MKYLLGSVEADTISVFRNNDPASVSKEFSVIREILNKYIPCDCLVRGMLLFLELQREIMGWMPAWTWLIPNCHDCHCNEVGSYGTVCNKISGECFVMMSTKNGNLMRVPMTYFTGTIATGINVFKTTLDFHTAKIYVTNHLNKRTDSIPVYDSTACNRNRFGSTSQQCDLITGQCPYSEKYHFLKCLGFLNCWFGPFFPFFFW